MGKTLLPIAEFKNTPPEPAQRRCRQLRFSLFFHSGLGEGAALISSAGGPRERVGGSGGKFKGRDACGAGGSGTQKS